MGINTIRFRCSRKIFWLLFCFSGLSASIAAQESGSGEPYGTAYSLMAVPPDNYRLGIRSNLLHWAVLTPNAGAEWRISKNYGVIFNAGYTKWNWKDGERRFHFWYINPEARWYLGVRKRAYFGVEFHHGNFNIKLNDIGRDGYFRGGGLTGGYQLYLSQALSLDFNVGVGCTRGFYTRYPFDGNANVPEAQKTRTVWGLTQAGVSLVWKIFNR